MGIAECWHCPNCGLEMPWTQEKEIEEHDCYTWLDDQDLFALDYEDYERIP